MRKEMETLALGINEYEIVDGKARPVNSVAEMKAIQNLVAGNTIKTIGYYSANDGGEGLYRIRAKEDSDVENNGTIHFIGDSLVAELITNGTITVNQFGAKGDGITDDTTAIQNALNYAIENKLKLEFVRKTYIITNTLNITRPKGYLGLLIDGNNAEIKTIAAISNEYILNMKTAYTEPYGQQGITIKNLYINGNYINKGINIENTNMWSLQNVQVNNCLYGIRLTNTYYGNIDNSCQIGNCFYGLLFDDSDETTANEVNTIYVGNISAMMKSEVKSLFTTDLTESVAIKIDTLINSVKFIGCVLEHYDYGFKGCEFRNSPNAGHKGSFTIDRCYLEKLGILFDFRIKSSSQYFQPTAEISNCRIFPLGTVTSSKKGYLECGNFNIHNNQQFTLVIGNNPIKLKITTDIDDFFMDLTNINTQVTINKNSIPSYTNYDEKDISGYENGISRNKTYQENNLLIFPLVIDDALKTVKNYKAMSINSQNICFKQEGAIPVGLVINGEDGNKYMISTEDGTTVKLVKMNNMSRIYNDISAKDALWLYRHRNSLPNGTQIFCNDIEKTVKLVRTNDTDGKWIETKTNHLAIGTSSELNAYMSSNPQNKWWCECWDVSFNRCVYYNVTRYDLGYDWFKNNDPKNGGNNPVSILVYGTKEERPATPTFKSYYYATDENKYYKYDGTAWTEFTPEYV